MNVRLLVVSAVALVAVGVGVGCGSSDDASSGDDSDSGAQIGSDGSSNDGSNRDGSIADGSFTDVAPIPDAGGDTSADASVDDAAALDAGEDASADAGNDASNDAGMDASEDAGSDASTAAPSFTAAPAVKPNVLLGGTTTTGLLKFTLPALATGTASSVAFTVSSGGAASTVTKTGGTTVVPSDLGTVISVDPPTTTGADRKTFTYSIAATDSASRTSNTETATADVYPTNIVDANDRVGATATLLSSGKVLLIGGGSSIQNGICVTDASSNSAEIYDATTGTTTAVSSKMVASRCQHSAVLAGNDKVYVFGGANTTSVDVFDVASNAFQQVSLPTISVARIGQTATFLGGSSSSNSGKIVIAGGYNPVTTNARSSIELFDPSAGTSTVYTSTASVARAEHTATLMGKWLVLVGGTTTNASIDALDTTSAASSTTNIQTTSAPSNAVARFAHAAIAVDATSFIVAGGIGAADTTLKGTQRYTVSTSGAVTAVTVGQNLTVARARFALVDSGVASKYLAIGGTTTLAGSGTSDTATATVEEIDATATLATSSFATLVHARQACAAVDLGISSATNSVFLVAGGASTADSESLIGP